MALFTAKVRGFPVPVNGGSRLYTPPVNGGLTGTGAYGGWAYGVPVLTGDRGGKPRPRYGGPVGCPGPRAPADRAPCLAWPLVGAPRPPAAGAGTGARVQRARIDERGVTQRSAARKRGPRTHRERAARGLPTPVDRARRARCASARPLVVRALPAGAGARSKRAARAGRRTGRTLVVSAPPDGAGGARERHARSDRHEEKRKSRRRTKRANAPARLRRREPPVVYARAARAPYRAPYPPALGLGARERRAGGDGRDKRNDAKPPTKSGA